MKVSLARSKIGRLSVLAGNGLGKVDLTGVRGIKTPIESRTPDLNPVRVPQKELRV